MQHSIGIRWGQAGRFIPVLLWYFALAFDNWMWGCSVPDWAVHCDEARLCGWVLLCQRLAYGPHQAFQGHQLTCNFLLNSLAGSCNLQAVPAGSAVLLLLEVPLYYLVT